MRIIPISSSSLAAAVTVGVVLSTAAIGAGASSPVTLEGPVVAFTGGLGAGLPILTVDDPALGDTEVRLGPFWFLTAAGFTAAPGESVRLTAYPCPLCDVAWVAAVAENLSTGAVVTLRGDDGLPLWIGALGQGHGPSHGHRPGPAVGSPAGRGPGPGRGADAPPHWAPRHGFGPCPAPPDLGAAATVTGTVVSFTGEPSARFPMLTLNVDGSELALAAGPYRVWIGAGFEPVSGQELTVSYAPVALTGGEEHLVLLTLTDSATGLTLVFRDPETGIPGTGCCRHRP